jgi:hypothetical protein
LARKGAWLSLDAPQHSTVWLHHGCDGVRRITHRKESDLKESDLKAQSTDDVGLWKI